MLKSPSLYYEESGAILINRFIKIVLISLVATLLGGIAYAYSIFYISLVYINIFITLAYGGFIGYIVGIGAQNAKVRNIKVVMLLAASMALIGGYTAWVFTLTADGKGFWLNPIEIFKQIQIFVEEGYWGVFGWTPNGVVLCVIWFLEALTVTVASVMAAVGSFGTTPFCENCEVWCKGVVLTKYLECPFDLDRFILALESKNYTVLTDLANNLDYTTNRLQIEMLNCPSCRQSHYLKITSVGLKMSKKGDKKEESIVLVENLYISAVTYDLIIEWSKTLEEPVATATA